MSSFLPKEGDRLEKDPIPEAFSGEARPFGRRSPKMVAECEGDPSFGLESAKSMDSTDYFGFRRRKPKKGWISCLWGAPHDQKRKRQSYCSAGGDFFQDPTQNGSDFGPNSSFSGFGDPNSKIGHYFNYFGFRSRKPEIWVDFSLSEGSPLEKRKRQSYCSAGGEFFQDPTRNGSDFGPNSSFS